MVGFGVLLIVLGIGSLLLPMMDIQFTLMALFDDYQPIAGIVVAAIGVVLLMLGMRRRTQTVVVQQPPASPEPPAT
jgi:protein-S-isoprenylcysteine O-methyltransferase Ste14